MTLLGIISITKFTDKMIRQSHRGSIKAYEKVRTYQGILVSILGGLLFIIAYTILPVLLGRTIMSYIWLLGIAGIL